MTDKEPYNVKTEEDFNKVLEELDKEMREENLPIVARQFQGWFRFSSRFGLNLRNDDPLSRKVFDWFAARYGDKLNIDFASNKIGIIIRGDIYKMKFPTVYGQVSIICDAKWMGKAESAQIASGSVFPVVNVLDCVEGLTNDYASVLSQVELQELNDLFLFGYEATLNISEATGGDFVEQAKGDIVASITHLFDAQPQFGLSKWASLQAVEKFTKAFILKSSGVKPKFTHNLQELVDTAAIQGLPILAPTDIDKIQCAAGVRYGEVSVSLNEAVEAHHAAIKVCAEIAKSL